MGEFEDDNVINANDEQYERNLNEEEILDANLTDSEKLDRLKKAIDNKNEDLVKSLSAKISKEEVLFEAFEYSYKKHMVNDSITMLLKDTHMEKLQQNTELRRHFDMILKNEEREQNFDKVRALIEEGADINAKNGD